MDSFLPACTKMLFINCTYTTMVQLREVNQCLQEVGASPLVEKQTHKGGLQYTTDLLFSERALLPDRP